MDEVSKDLSPPVVRGIFKLRSEQACNLKQGSQFFTQRVNSVYHGPKSVSFLGPKIWDLVLNELTSIRNLVGFKKVIKKWSSENCPCTFYKNYVSNVGLFEKRATILAKIFDTK